jgi:hypothetical protein
VRKCRVSSCAEKSVLGLVRKCRVSSGAEKSILGLVRKCIYVTSKAGNRPMSGIDNYLLMSGDK